MRSVSPADCGPFVQLDALLALFEQAVDPPAEVLRQGEQAQGPAGRRGVEDDAVVAVGVAHHVDEAVEERGLVGAGRPVGEFDLAVDFVDDGRADLLAQRPLYAHQVFVDGLLGVDLHRRQGVVTLDRPGVVVEGLVEDVGGAVCRVRRDEQDLHPRAGTLVGVGAGDGGLADAAFPAEEDKLVHQKWYWLPFRSSADSRSHIRRSHPSNSSAR